MNKWYLKVLTLPLIAWIGFSYCQNPEKVISDFSLPCTNGQTVCTADYPDAKGYMVIFTCNHCPFAKLYTLRFNELAEKYTPLGVPLLAVNSMDTLMYEEESFALMKERATAFRFPYLQDAAQIVGKAFGAEHTPQAYVIWRESDRWVVKYSGAIDDNGERPETARSFISAAVSELLAGKPVSVPETESFGCRIFYRN